MQLLLCNGMHKGDGVMVVAHYQELGSTMEVKGDILLTKITNFKMARL